MDGLSNKETDGLGNLKDSAFIRNASGKGPEKHGETDREKSGKFSGKKRKIFRKKAESFKFPSLQKSLSARVCVCVCMCVCVVCMCNFQDVNTIEPFDEEGKKGGKGFREPMLRGAKGDK